MVGFNFHVGHGWVQLPCGAWLGSIWSMVGFHVGGVWLVYETQGLLSFDFHVCSPSSLIPSLHSPILCTVL